MKILMISMLAGISLWCNGPEANKKSLKTHVHEKQLRTDTILPGITDTTMPKIPLSKTPYYPDREVPSQEDKYTISGGRFDEHDLTNIVYHAPIKRDSLGFIQRFGDSRIDFFDLENHLTGSYNITASNPYKPSQYKNFLSEAYMNYSAPIIDKRAFPTYDWRKDVVQFATTWGAYENAQCSNVVVAYYLQALGEDRTLLSVMATFVLLDHKGKEIARFEDVEDVFFGEGLFTCDQKYFCFRYGGLFTIAGESMYNDHFRIYDIESKKNIYEWELPKAYQFATEPHEKPGGWVRMAISLNDSDAVRQDKGQEQAKIAFDINNRVKYTSPFDPRLNFIRSFTEDGFIIKDPKTKVFERIWYKNWQSEKF